MSELAIGLMSGTSCDGMDAALVRIEGFSTGTRLELVDFISLSYSREVREKLLSLVKGDNGGSAELSRINFAVGELSRQACLEVCRKAGVQPSEIAFIGSHGHTFYHEPNPVDYLGMKVASTLQLGEASVINETFPCPVVSDFRVRDVAAGGQGAPLVPYTEFILYRSETENVALQNIGGIGNVTILPENCRLSDVFAFDTGPGNMIIDALVSHFSKGKQRFDDNGRIAASGKVDRKLLAQLCRDEYFSQPVPKSTGRERFGEQYVAAMLQENRHLSPEDLIATATAFTASSIRMGLEDFCHPVPNRLLVSGGGASNQTLMEMIQQELPDVIVEKNPLSDSKEAVAFAVLANERLHQTCSNALGATGAAHPVVLGKVSI